jgi:hypothetical protein
VSDLDAAAAFQRRIQQLIRQLEDERRARLKAEKQAEFLRTLLRRAQFELQRRRAASAPDQDQPSIR